MDVARNIHVTRVYGKETVEAFLAPVAEAVADLMANADFDLVRHCEGEACVLWFYDRTKDTAEDGARRQVAEIVRR